MRTIINISLAQFGSFTVISASSGAEAVELFAADRPAMVILDVCMPGMSGVETYNKLRELPGGDTTPIAFLSARDGEEEIQQLRAMGAVDVLSKPFDIKSFAGRIRSILNNQKTCAKQANQHE